MTTLYVDNIAPNLNSTISAPNLDVPLSDGQIVQVVQASDATVQTSTSSTWVPTATSVSITPKYTDSLIFIQASMAGEVYGSSNMGIAYAIYKGSTQLYNSQYDIYNSGNNAQRIEKVSVWTHETSGSTASRTYTVNFRAAGSGTARNNNYGAPSRILVWEIKQ